MRVREIFLNNNADFFSNIWDSFVVGRSFRTRFTFDTVNIFLIVSISQI